MIGRRRDRSVPVVKTIQFPQCHLELPFPFQISDRQTDIFRDLTRKPGQSLKPGNRMPGLITVRHTLRMPLGNNLGPFVFRLTAAILNPDATGFLVQQCLEQLASVLQIVLPCHFPFCGNRDLDRVRFLAAQSQMIKE